MFASILAFHITPPGSYFVTQRRHKNMCVSMFLFPTTFQLDIFYSLSKYLTTIFYHGIYLHKFKDVQLPLVGTKFKYSLSLGRPFSPPLPFPRDFDVIVRSQSASWTFHRGKCFPLGIFKTQVYSVWP